MTARAYPDTETLLTLHEAAQRLKVGRGTVRYYALRARVLPYVPIGRELRFLPEDVETFIQSRRQAGNDEAGNP